MADLNSVHKPDGRFWHSSQCFGEKVYIWGGRTPQYRRKRNKETPGQQTVVTIEEFNSRTRSWHSRGTDGDPHPGLSEVACASFETFLYFYGGNSGKDLNGVLSQLDLNRMTWLRLSSEKAKKCPMKKDACGMVHFKTNGGKQKLLVMCGYAQSNDGGNTQNGGSSDENSRFRVQENENATETTGWTNEIHLFNIESGHEGVWTIPKINESTRPEPCGNVTITGISHQQAIFCGGYETICLYLIKIDSEDDNAVEIEKINYPKERVTKSGVTESDVTQRAAGCLGFNTNNPYLLLCGGRPPSDSKELPNDISLLDIASKTWKREKLPDHHAIMARWGHSIAIVTHADWLIEVLMFGGTTDPYNEDDWNKFNEINRLAQPISFIYGFFQNEWILIGVDDSESWWFGERIKEMAQGVIIKEKYLPVAKQRREEKNSPNETMEDSPKIGLRGVDVCGETCITVTNSTQFFEWERFGLKVHVEENSLPTDIEQMTVNIKASISGHYESPEGYERVSAVFWFQCEPNIELKKQVTVEIQHCAMSEHTPELSFARAVCTQEKLPYTFTLLKDGQFSNQSAYGVLNLSRFSAIAAFIKKLMSVKRIYYASLFHQTKESGHEIYVVVTQNIAAHLDVVKKKYRNAQPGPEQLILFESDKISLNIPMEGIDCPNGWKIIPLKPTVIKKQDVDDYKSGRGIPSCHLLARVVDQSTTEPLQHTITLDGAEPPHNEFNIVIDPGTQNRSRPAPEPSTSSAYCLSDVDSSVTLGENDHLLDVMGEVMSKKASYYALGRGLRIFPGELDAVRAQYHSTSLDSALNDVLLLWLRQKYDTVRFGPPTWRMLVEAVENRAGLNDRALAAQIAQKHAAH